ncbi:MAG: hypothetical protein OXD39_15005 [Gemmatimonadetes bacterium]|nr:hypothetical protein [Gemmatimonadota bacterium]
MYPLLLAILLVTETAYAQSNSETVECTDFQGYNYVIPLGQIDKGAWGEDTIKGGKLYYESVGGKSAIEGGTPVITFVPASGKPITSLDDSILARYADIPLGLGGSDIVVVEYVLGGTMEVYFFNLDDDGNGVVLFTTIRSSAIINNSRLLVGQCKTTK